LLPIDKTSPPIIHANGVTTAKGTNAYFIKLMITLVNRQSCKEFWVKGKKTMRRRRRRKMKNV